MTKGIITIIGWNRPKYLKRVLDSVLLAYNYNKYDIHISIDYSPKTLTESTTIINDFITNIETNVIVEYQTTQLGNTGNTRRSADFAFIDNNYDYMIHLEDDTIMGKDYILWCEWANNTFGKDPNNFCNCPFIPTANKIGDNIINITDPTLSLKRNFFEAQGGFIINKSQYDYILSLGGFFGAGAPPKNVKSYNDYKNRIPINDKFAFDGPMNRYFIRDKYVVSPYISRGQNIGEENGVWNPSKEWHNKNILNKLWIDSKEFITLDLQHIQYKLQ